MIQPLPCRRIRLNSKERRIYIGRSMYHWPDQVCKNAWQAKFELLRGAPVVYLVDSQIDAFRELVS